MLVAQATRRSLHCTILNVNPQWPNPVLCSFLTATNFSLFTSLKPVAPVFDRRCSAIAGEILITYPSGQRVK